MSLRQIERLQGHSTTAVQLQINQTIRIIIDRIKTSLEKSNQISK